MILLINLGQAFVFHDHHVSILTTPSNAKLILKHLNPQSFNFFYGLQNLSFAQDNKTTYKISKVANLLKPEMEKLKASCSKTVFMIWS